MTRLILLLLTLLFSLSSPAMGKNSDFGLSTIAANKAPIIMGENMGRVQSYASKVGGQTINDFVPSSQWSMGANKAWVQQMRAEGRQIIDIAKEQGHPKNKDTHYLTRPTARPLTVFPDSTGPAPRQKPPQTPMAKNRTPIICDADGGFLRRWR